MQKTLIDPNSTMIAAHRANSNGDLSRLQRREPLEVPGIEADITRLWEQLLGAPSGASDEDFLKRGSPTQLVRLLEEVNGRFGIELTISDVFRSRTVRQLAEAIQEARQGLRSSVQSKGLLVPLQANGSKTPIFAIHAVEGTVYLYEPLAKALGSDQPFLAIESPLLHQADGREMSVPELASTYVSLIEKYLPSGPYLLIGASFGGHVAYEMAQLLHAQGKEPALLLLIDSVVPGSEIRVEVAERANSVRSNFREEGLSYLVRKLKIKLRYTWDWYLSLYRKLACSLHRALKIALPPRLQFFHVEASQRRALFRHDFQKYPGSMALARAIYRDDILRKRDDETLGWGPLAAGRFEIYHIPVNHISMLDWPAVESFAELIRKLLPK